MLSLLVCPSPENQFCCPVGEVGYNQRRKGQEIKLCFALLMCFIFNDYSFRHAICCIDVMETFSVGLLSAQACKALACKSLIIGLTILLLIFL